MDESGRRAELPFELTASGVIATVYARRPEFLPVLAAYLWDAGVGTIELSVTMDDCRLAISALRETPSTVGASAVADAAQADAIIDAGASFVSAHSAASALIGHCAQRRVPVIVRARAVDEAKAAWDHGASAVKLDCGSGGPRLTRAVSAAHPVIPVIAAGQIDDRTAREHIQAGACAVAAGVWLLGVAAEGRNLDDIASRARSLVAAVTAAGLQRSPL